MLYFILVKKKKKNIISKTQQQSLSLSVAMANRLNSTLSLPFGMPSWESNKRLQAQGILILTFFLNTWFCFVFFFFSFLKYILSGKMDSNPARLCWETLGVTLAFVILSVCVFNW